MKKRIGMILILAAVLLIGGTAFYFQDYYHLTDEASALESTETVVVLETENGYYFDGPGEEQALVFYPGAKVEDLAYSELMKAVASEGTDCFLVHMPANFAFFGKNRAEDLMEAYDYKEWYMAGHSLGGVVAAMFTEEHLEQVDGIVFLASYSTKDFSGTDLKGLSIYGSEDRVLSMEQFEENRTNLPPNSEIYCIEGGNHEQFGDYGHQKGDGEATISRKEQIDITAAKITELCR